MAVEIFSIMVFVMDSFCYSLHFVFCIGLSPLVYRVYYLLNELMESVNEMEKVTPPPSPSRKIYMLFYFCKEIKK
jgi:hypothetical protein